MYDDITLSPICCAETNQLHSTFRRRQVGCSPLSPSAFPVYSQKIHELPAGSQVVCQKLRWLWKMGGFAPNKTTAHLVKYTRLVFYHGRTQEADPVPTRGEELSYGFAEDLSRNRPFGSTRKLPCRPSASLEARGSNGPFTGKSLKHESRAQRIANFSTNFALRHSKSGPSTAVPGPTDHSPDSNPPKQPGATAREAFLYAYPAHCLHSESWSHKSIPTEKS